jgi:ABC-type transport system substrate-binding protein
MTGERIALRRAIASALDVEMLVRVVYAGHALPANQIVPPGVGGHDATLPSKPQYDPATSKALLDRFGYTKGADGHRRTPDGSKRHVKAVFRGGAR